jgi:hypothetical protein
MRALFAFAIVALLPAGAGADVMSITATGRWDELAGTTPVSAPGLRWSFSFDAVSPLAPDHTASISHFTFSLDGSPIAASATFVEFFAGSSSGLFDVALAGGDFIELFGHQAFGSGGALIPGLYSATIHLVDLGSGLSADGTGQVTIAADPAAVPEPSSLAALATGGVALGGLRAAKRRRFSSGGFRPPAR